MPTLHEEIIFNHWDPEMNRGGSKPRSNKRRQPYDHKEFIAWDGEGTTTDICHVPPSWVKPIEWQNFKPETPREAFPSTVKDACFTGLTDVPYSWTYSRPQQDYVLLANSKEQRITREDGLTTLECLDFILQTKQEFPQSIFVGFGFNYDVAQIIRDLPWQSMWQLYEKGNVRYGHFWLKWLPRKSFVIRNTRTKQSAIIYDVIGFFQSAFLPVCEKYLGKDHPDLRIIKEGKESRDTFEWKELEDKIIPYNDMELRMLVEIMTILREDLHNVDLDISQWHGPGAVANRLLQRYGVGFHMDKDIPLEVHNAAKHAYAGGRFEHFWLGYHPHPVYEYDLHSAYPAAATHLPSLCNGTWEYTQTFEPEAFGVWYIDYAGDRNPYQPGPLFCRSPDGRVGFPKDVKGWYWTPEANLVPDHVRYGWVLRPATSDRPFAFIEELYDLRRQYQEAGNPAERAIKLALNSIYGKLAQLIGGKDGQSPKWHQLEWAGYITSYTRAAIYKAILTNPDAIIAAETDAVFSTEPLHLDIGPGLGQWEEKTFDSILYLQSGFYYATEKEKGAVEKGKSQPRVVCKYRGMDRDREGQHPAGLPYRRVLDHLRNSGKLAHGKTKPLLSVTTRFVNIGLALRTDAIFRSWETKTKELHLDTGPGKSKRKHVSNQCGCCQNRKSLGDCLHPMEVSGYSGISYPHKLPWEDVLTTEELEYYLDMERVHGWQDEF